MLKFYRQLPDTRFTVSILKIYAQLSHELSSSSTLIPRTSARAFSIAFPFSFLSFSPSMFSSSGEAVRSALSDALDVIWFDALLKGLVCPVFFPLFRLSPVCFCFANADKACL